MSPVPPRSRFRPTRNDDLLRLGGEALRFGVEAYGQSWTITSRSWRREIERVVSGVKTSAPPSSILRGLAGGYANWLGELAVMVPSVAEKATMEFAQGRRGVIRSSLPPTRAQGLQQRVIISRSPASRSRCRHGS
jgi:hypothetical protein